MGDWGPSAGFCPFRPAVLNLSAVTRWVCHTHHVRFPGTGGVLQSRVPLKRANPWTHMREKDIIEAIVLSQL